MCFIVHLHAARRLTLLALACAGLQCFSLDVFQMGNAKMTTTATTKVASTGALEETPKRFARKLCSPQEMAAIEMGGAL